MNRNDRRRWHAARTLTHLGELTALWLEGHLTSHPGYHTGRGPDPETEPLVPVLARLNRAGYLTTASQPGLPPTPGYDGRLWHQRAAVEGITDDTTLHRLTHAIAGTDLLLISHRTQVPPRWHRWLPFCWPLRPPLGDGAIPVTATTHGHDHTWFGGPMTYTDLELCLAEVSDHAFQAILTAWQVSILDPHWGRQHHLWDVLTERFLTHPTTTLREVTHPDRTERTSR